MDWKPEFNALIRNDFERRKSRNPRFSVRQYAKKIGLSVGATSELLRGQRSLSLDRALLLLQKLELPESETRRLSFLMGHSQLQKTSDGALPEKFFELAQDWVNFVLLSIYHEVAVSPEILPDLATQFGLDPQALQERIDEIRQTDLVPKEGGARIVMDFETWKQQSEGARKVHAMLLQRQAKMLEQSAKSPESSPLEFLTMISYFSEEQLSTLLREINSLVQRISLSSHQASSEKLYHLSVQLSSVPAGASSAQSTVAAATAPVSSGLRGAKVVPESAVGG